MSKKLKTYVLTVSRTFPSYHTRKGEPTYFPERMVEGFSGSEHAYFDFTKVCAFHDPIGAKIHTIRGNYNIWKKRIDEVNAGKAVLSLRYWEGRPYHTDQIEFLQLTKAGYQRVSVDFSGYNSCVMDQLETEFKLEYNSRICQNDGLSEDDFRRWFKGKKLDGIIIHFTDFRY